MAENKTDDEDDEYERVAYFWVGVNSEDVIEQVYYLTTKETLDFESLNKTESDKKKITLSSDTSKLERQVVNHKYAGENVEKDMTDYLRKFHSSLQNKQ